MLLLYHICDFMILDVLRAGGEGTTEDEMFAWHHQLNGHSFDKAPRDSEGQESLAYCSPWGCKDLDTTEPLNNNILYCSPLISVHYYGKIHSFNSGLLLAK